MVGMIPRTVTARLLDALAHRPVVLLHGPRQAGKSTLVAALAAGPHPATYVTLDDLATLASARRDPPGFVQSLPDAVVLDEIQRAPDVLLAIKREIDRDRRPGRFLLTGSANVLLLPGLADTLVGRMEMHTLWPLSQGEIEGTRDEFVDAVFADGALSFADSSEPWTSVLERIVRGGYPEVVTGGASARRQEWFGAYVTTILQREVREIANVEALIELPRLLTLVATRAGSVLNVSDLARGTGIALTTVRRYLALLETTFLVQTLRPWATNIGKRLVKAPKAFLADTGLMLYLLGVDRQRLEADPLVVGPALETFVAMELRKQISWSRTQPTLLHFRTAKGHEVDFVLEARGGRVVGIEVKAAAMVNESDFRGLHKLAQAAGRRFHRGVLVYRGERRLPFGSKMDALPVSALWRLGAGPPVTSAR